MNEQVNEGAALLSQNLFERWWLYKPKRPSENRMTHTSLSRLKNKNKKNPQR